MRQAINDESLRAFSAHLKDYVRTTVMAFQDGAGSQDAPFTADLAIAAMWREIDLWMENVGALEGTSWYRISVATEDLSRVVAEIDRAVDVDTMTCVGARFDGDLNVLYLTVKDTKLETLQFLVGLVGWVGLRDWRWY